MTTEPLLQEYRQYAEESGREQDPEVQNAAHDNLIDVVRRLRDSGQGHRILELLGDPSPHVRLRAGFDALYLSPDDGLRVLRELALDPGDADPWTVDVILRLWGEGELSLYPWEDDDAPSTAGAERQP